MRATGHISKADVVSGLLCTLLFSAWSYRTGGRFVAAEPVFFAFFVLVSCIWGRLTLAALGLHRIFERSFPFTFLIGSLEIGFCTAALKVTTELDLRQLFAIVAFLGIVGYTLFRIRIRRWSIAGRVEEAGLAAILVSLLGPTCWLWHLCPQRITIGDVAVLRVFNEYYAQTVNSFPLLANTQSFRLGSFHFAGEPLSFYHWACYSYPALLHVFTGQPALDTLAAFWFPFGFFLFGLAAFCLARTWFGPSAGYWAAVAATVLPDPTYWAADIIFFTADRLIEASPGMAYASAAAAVSLLFVTAGIRHQSALAIRLGIVGAFASAFFKVNIILASLPICFFVLCCCPRQYRGPMTRRLTLEFLGLGILALIAGLQLRSAPTFLPDPKFGDEYFARIATFLSAESALRPYVEYLWKDRILAIFARGIFILVVTFQWYLAAFVVAWVGYSLTARKRWLLRMIPLFSFGVYAFFAVFLAPNQNGDPFELQHRTFVWYHLVLMTWTAGALVSTARLWHWPRLPFAFGLLLLVLPAYFGKDMRMPQPDLVVSRGFVEAAEFIRDHSTKQDAFVDSEDDPWLVATALVERRTFVCLASDYNFPGHGTLREARLKRWKENTELQQMTTAGQIADWSKRTDVRWCLLHPTTPVRWPKEFLDHPAFESLGYRVYDFATLPRSANAGE